uniref:Myosin heavy chain-related protein n=1 Tax=Tanacetum cinerariifolium TaxID=118510 RepID=A0A6L2NP17_TANCI|nr:myosin heavy chain-related protein [Tanacetum cinerariifolium]
MGDDVDINTLTMERYLALIQDNIRQGIVKPEISNDIEFEIIGNFMRELRRKLFKGTDEEYAQEHVRRKAKEDEGGMDDGWDITIKDVERLRKILTPTIHTLPNLEIVVQPYMPRGPVRDEVKVVRGEELEYDILIQNSMMQPLTPQTVHIIPPDDDDVAPTTNPILDKHLNGFGKEFSQQGNRIRGHINSDPCELLRARPTSLEEAFSLARISEARFEDERSTTTIAKTNDLNTELPIQDLEETIRHKLNKVEAVKTSMVATSEELEQQEYQDDLNEISEEEDDALSKLLQRKTGKAYIFTRSLLFRRIIEARFEAIAHEDKATTEKEQNIKETGDTSLQSVVASLKAKGSLDANEEIKKDHTLVHDLKKQVEKLPMELQLKTTLGRL